jgi:hypothetical protein
MNMVKNLVKRILEGALVGSLLLGNSVPVYAPPVSFNFNSELVKPEKKYRSITESFKSKRAKRSHKRILSYAGETDTLWIPEYSLKDVSPTNCARYSRFVAEDVFGLKYKYDDDVKSKYRGAWNYRYYNKVVASSEEGFNKQDLIELVKENELQPGMLMGIYNPKSNYNNWNDKTKNKVKYTHMAVFLGMDNSGSLIFANQLGKNTQIIDQNYFLNRNWKFKEIIDVLD